MSEELDELIEMARTIRMTPGQGIPCLERRETLRLRSGQAMGHPRRSFAYGNVKIENDSISWDRIDRAAEGLEERWADLLLAGSSGFAMPESVLWALWRD